MGASPPQFNPPRQQSSNKIWLWLLLAVGVFCVICGIGGFFMFRTVMDAGMGLVSCSMNGDLARDAVLAYALDHDGKFPPAATWQDDVRPYYERLYNKLISEKGYKEISGMMSIKVSPPGTPLDCDFGGSHKTGFAYNSLLAGKLKSEFPDSTVVIFETDSPVYNQANDPATRPKETPKMWGDERPWLDFWISGQSELGSSANTEMDFETKPEDGLPPANPGTTGGAPNPPGS